MDVGSWPTAHDRDRLEDFLAELGTLSQRYDVVIGGCGDCGSPWVHDRVSNRVAGLHLATEHAAASGVDPEYHFLDGSILDD